MTYFCMNGAGNSFVVLDARGKRLDFPELAKSLCALHRADGLIAVGNSDKADFKMIFYNADGSLGEMCGNGARCICRFAHDQGIAGDTMVFEATAGLVRGWRVDESQYRVALNLPSVLDLHRKGDIAYVELGAPVCPTPSGCGKQRRTSSRTRMPCGKKCAPCALTRPSPRGPM